MTPKLNEDTESMSDEFYTQLGNEISDKAQVPGWATPEPAIPNDVVNNNPDTWAVHDNDYWGAPHTTNSIPPGAYTGHTSERRGIYLSKQTLKTDDLLILPDNIMTSVIAEFKLFWASKAKFSSRGFLHKRGFLLWGKPGAGKTSLIQLLIKDICEEYKGIVYFVEDPNIAKEAFTLIRKIESDRPIVALMEDIDSLLQQYSENKYLSLLDGESQVDNIVFIATTNYPSRLDPRFVDRPSRFDTIIKLDMPSEEARKHYLNIKEPSLTGEELNKWLKATNNFSLAHLRELLIAVKCLDQDFNETVKRIANMKNRKDENSKDIGFAFKE